MKKDQKKSAIDKILELLDKYVDTTGAILDDYVADDGMVTELGAADQNLREAIEEFQHESEEDELKSIVARLKELEPDQEQSLELLEVLDEDAIWDWSKSEGYAYVKCQTMEQHNKLEEFVTTEMYPHYNERENYEIW